MELILFGNEEGLVCLWIFSPTYVAQFTNTPSIPYTRSSVQKHDMPWPAKLFVYSKSTMNI